MMTISDIKKRMPKVCRQFKIRYVEIFGSIARNENTDDSDIDLIIEFEEPIEEETSIRYFGFLHFIEDTFNKKVDLLTPRSIKNPFLKETIDREKIRIYG